MQGIPYRFTHRIFIIIQDIEIRYTAIRLKKTTRVKLPGQIRPSLTKPSPTKPNIANPKPNLT